MNPLELGMYHQIKNFIRVNPSFYEYLFMVDGGCWYDRWYFVGKPFDLSICLFFLAFTIIYLTKMLGSMIHDKKLQAVCGETELANAKQSLIMMMQVSAWSSVYLAWHIIVWFRYTNTSFLTTWRRHSKVFSGPLPAYLVVSLFTDGEKRLIPTNRCWSWTN